MSFGTSSVFALIIVLISRINCIGFELGYGATRCLAGMSHKGEVVTGTFDVSEVPNVPVLLSIEDQRNHLLYRKESAAKGRFAFTTDIDSDFRICFKSMPTATSNDKRPRDVLLEVEQGFGSKKYDELAKADKLKPLEIEVAKLDDLSADLLQDFVVMRAREDEIRQTNEWTSSKILYFAMFCMVCLLSIGVWQVMYLKRYFKAKKLIE